MSEFPAGGTPVPAAPADRSWMPMVSGILQVCAGLSSLVGGVVLAFIAATAHTLPAAIQEPVPEAPFALGASLFLLLALMILALAAVAILGGIQQLRGARGFWPIAGSIAATLLMFPLGITAVVLTVIFEQDANAARRAGVGP